MRSGGRKTPVRSRGKALVYRKGTKSFRSWSILTCAQHYFVHYINNNNNSNNLLLLGLTSNRAINTVQHPPRCAALYTVSSKPAKLLPHTAHSSWINLTGLTSWSFTRWRDRHRSIKLLTTQFIDPDKMKGWVGLCIAFRIFEVSKVRDLKFGRYVGATKNAGVENAIRSKLQERKMREWK